ncbi:hypothetical protein GXM_01173 [Nostoc sphaeroides CCNUC1]|uniref:Uncharacterized protein n=1 Tax=Nostoc sphaeroides CCNUC1 TaxID=2653204 RepID=A0A5P8VTJ9_9NOSO|nr:hypothetical protein GXM_01173 [Nostoc sphaeroides CCNUC1]
MQPCPVFTPVTKICVHCLPSRKVPWHCSPSHSFYQNIKNRVQDFPHIDFTLATTWFWFWNHLTQKFILGAGQVTGVCFTHVPLSVLSIIYSQLTLREFFYHLFDFSNNLLVTYPLRSWVYIVSL